MRDFLVVVRDFLVVVQCKWASGCRVYGTCSR